MNFVIVPPDQPLVPVRVTMYPAESDPGPFPVPSNAPIENWPMAHNEDAGALPKPGQTLEDIQRHGTGDRHLLIVDPAHGKLHEFWQARLTDTGWEASQASTFDLTSNAMRPLGWTSSDAAGLPVFPSVVRYEEVAKGEVRHALRVTVRRSRRAYVYPARHFASPHTDPALPRMGERLRLKASFDTSGFPPHARVILEALKKYGMFVADNGQDWLMSISPDRRFAGLESLSKVKRIRLRGDCAHGTGRQEVTNASYCSRHGADVDWRSHGPLCPVGATCRRPLPSAEDDSDRRRRRLGLRRR